MSRFILNLKEAADEPDQESTVNKSTVRFNSNRLIGNMGESLDLDNETEALEEETGSIEAHSHSGVEGLQSAELTEA